jgi:translocation and assembly module TamB
MAETVRPVPARFRARAWLAALSALLVLATALAGGIWLAWRTDPGMRWLIRQVPGLQLESLQGRPDGGPLSAARVDWRLGGFRIILDGLSWRDARWHWRPHAGAWLRLELTGPAARRVELIAQDAPGGKRSPPAQAPDDLRLPLELIVRELQVGVLAVNGQPVLTDLASSFHLGDGNGLAHRVQQLCVRAGLAQACGHAEVAATGTMAATGRIEMSALSGATTRWQAEADLGGTVAAPTLDATLRTAADAQVKVQATLAPFAAWPLASLEASVRDLDLATLAAGLPTTRLSGRAVINGRRPGTLLRADIDLGNTAPAPWNQGGLPLRQLRATVRTQTGVERVLEFSGLELAFAGQGDAGRLSGTGRWQGRELTLDTRVHALRPALIDSRLGPMALSGPLRAILRGLPAPPGTTAPVASVPMSGELSGGLEGQLGGRRAKPVRLEFAGKWMTEADKGWQAQLERLHLEAAGARATLSARLARDAVQGWRLRSEGELTDFDPSAWWAGSDEALWRRGPHALDAAWSADVTLPAADTPAPAASMLRALRGEASLQLRDSRIAGVPLQGTLAFSARPGDVQLDGTLQAAGNRITLAGHAGAGPAQDSWNGRIDAPSLKVLAPLAELLGEAGRWLPTEGGLQGRAQVEGAWPELRTQGELTARNARSARWQIGQADARWHLAGLQADGPVQLTLSASRLAYGTQRVDPLRADLGGTVRAHRLELQASTQAAAPVPTGTGARGKPETAGGSTLRITASGGWEASPQGGGTWRGKLLDLQAAEQGGTTAPWLSARELDGQLGFGPEGRLAQAVLSPGRIALLGATLRWTQAMFQAAGVADAAPRILLDAHLDPLPIAPWLARFQPGLGWRGDLKLGGHVRVRSGERFDADALIERISGDLSLTEGGTARALGLTDARLALTVQDGRWQFTQAVAGRQLGVVSGAQTVQAPAGAAWPPAEAALNGVLAFKVADLGAWAPWLPPGWRLGGRLDASAALGGRFGAPEYTGRMAGSDLGLRHLLEGVHLHDGELAVALRGSEAHIERCVFKGGNGILRVDGGAGFGVAPRGRLRIVAERFEALGRLDRRIVLTGSADVALQEERTALDGRFTVDEGLIDVSQADAPRLDDDVAMIDSAGHDAPWRQIEEQPTAAGPPGNSPLGQADVSLLVDLGSALQLRGRGLDTRLRGQVRLTTPEGRLAVHGTVRTESGTYAAYGQNLAIERGVLNFTGDVATPRLDILAVRPDLDVRVGVALAGSAADPRVQLYSEPAMSPLDQLSWLVMGRASEGLGGADTALLQRAALALLAGERGDSSGGMLKKIGLDELSVRQGETGDVGSTVVALGKQVSQRLYVGYERGLNAAAGSWQLIYRVARRLTVRLQSGEESSLDLIRTWRWD